MNVYPNFSFHHTSTPIEMARIGTLNTPHGSLTTPNFIFCATKASIKGLATHQAKEAGTKIILANTYHLMLNPGASHIAKRGGLHKFMNWHGPMLTDSGGYQIFAMGHGSVSAEIKKGTTRTLPHTLLSISEEGVVFKSYLDGSKIILTPELATSIQENLGADLLMQFDECTPFHVDKQYTLEAMRRSLRWGKRCLSEFSIRDRNTQAMYGILQGGVYKDLRKESIESIADQNFWGTAIGGSLGKDKYQMQDIVAIIMELLRSDKTLYSKRTVHLLGIGDIPDIFWGIKQGIDTFDCVHPTRIARHASAIVPATIATERKLNLKNSKFAHQDISIDPQCTQACCTQYTRAYIHHLFKAKELLGMHLLTLHNVAQISRLMKDIQNSLRMSISTGTCDEFTQLEKFWLG